MGLPFRGKSGIGVLVVCVMAPQGGFDWGPDGHGITGQLAQKPLTPAGASQVAATRNSVHEEDSRSLCPWCVQTAGRAECSRVLSSPGGGQYVDSRFIGMWGVPCE